MSAASVEVKSNSRKGPDRELTAIADYVPGYRARSRNTETACSPNWCSKMTGKKTSPPVILRTRI